MEKPVDKNEIFSIIKSIFNSELGLEEVLPSNNLRSLGVDDWNQLGISLNLEEKFDINLEVDINDWETVQDIIDSVANHLQII